MTGKHTGHATVRGNLRPEAGLRHGEPTVASILQRAGYRTALFGKWGLGGPGTRSVPNSRGFDEFFGYLDQLHAHNYYPEHLWENENEFFLTENWFGRKKQYSPDLFTARALDFVGRSHRSPFFLYLTYTIPHADNELAAYAGNGMEVPSDHPYSDRPWPQTEKNFAAMLARMDRDIGRLMETVKAAGLDENTLVIFTSDNGPHREGGHDPDFFGSRGALRGIKRDLYEGGIRVPFLARWPGKVPAGKISGQVLAFWDFLPTACELADMDPPDSLDGISVLAPLLGRGGVKHPPLYWEFHEGRFAQAVRSEDWKAVRNDAGRPVESVRPQGRSGREKRSRGEVSGNRRAVGKKDGNLSRQLAPVSSPGDQQRGPSRRVRDGWVVPDRSRTMVA